MYKFRMVFTPTSWNEAFEKDFDSILEGIQYARDFRTKNCIIISVHDQNDAVHYGTIKPDGSIARGWISNYDLSYGGAKECKRHMSADYKQALEHKPTVAKLA